MFHKHKRHTLNQPFTIILALTKPWKRNSVVFARGLESSLGSVQYANLQTRIVTDNYLEYFSKSSNNQKRWTKTFNLISSFVIFQYLSVAVAGKKTTQRSSERLPGWGSLRIERKQTPIQWASIGLKEGPYISFNRANRGSLYKRQ